MQSAGSAMVDQILGSGQVSIAGGQTTLSPQLNLGEIDSLSISGAGVLDITNNTLDINYTGTSPAAAVRGYLTSGFNGLKWNGPGINSSTAAAGKPPATAVGYNDTGSQVIVKYTWYGDTNLDGIVNAVDLGAMNPRGNVWADGDFTYDGKVNADDFALFELGSAVSNQRIIPEPAMTIALITLCGSSLGRRRFRASRTLE